MELSLQFILGSSSINHSLKKLDQLPVVVEVFINPVGLIGGAGGHDVLLCVWSAHVEPHHLAVRTSPMLPGELGVILEARSNCRSHIRLEFQSELGLS